VDQSINHRLTPVSNALAKLHSMHHEFTRPPRQKGLIRHSDVNLALQSTGVRGT
jgi:hypothetical protein